VLVSAAATAGVAQLLAFVGAARVMVAGHAVSSDWPSCTADETVLVAARPERVTARLRELAPDWLDWSSTRLARWTCSPVRR